MKFLKAVRNFLRKFDSFPATQFLRYNGESEYATATGGILSLIIIVIFIILFTSTGLDIVNRVTVTATSNFQHEIDPSAANITAGPDGDFMFALKIYGVDFNDPATTVFDVILTQESYSPIANLIFSQQMGMVPCTQNHFKFGLDVQAQFSSFNLSEWLCPPLNTEFQVEGKLTSQIYKQFAVNVMKCNSSRHSNCISNADLANLQSLMGYFTFAVLMVNTELNPSSSNNYKNYYFEDRNYFAFSTNLAVKVNADVQAFQISTDSSLLPFSHQIVEDGMILQQVFDHYTYPVANDNYVNLAFRKSTVLASYERTFQKLDGFVSYIGGLIGAIMGLLFFINSYNEICYRISLSNKLFCYDKDSNVNSNSFNIVYYFGILVYKICSFFGYCKEWILIKKYQACSQQVQKQLDVGYLMRRLIFIQRALYVIFDENQYQALHLQSRPTLSQIRKCREKMDLPTKLQKKIGEQSNKVENESNISRETEMHGISLQQIKYQSEISDSSAESIKSNSLKSIKNKIQNLWQPSLPPLHAQIRKNRKILNLVNKQFLKQVGPEHKNNKELQIKNVLFFEGATSEVGECSFEKVSVKNRAKTAKNEEDADQ